MDYITQKTDVSECATRDLSSAEFRAFCLSIPSFITWHLLIYVFYPQPDLFNSTMYLIAMIKYAIFFTYWFTKRWTSYQLSFHQIITWLNLCIGAHFLSHSYNATINFRMNPVYAYQNGVYPSLYFLWIVSRVDSLQEDSYWRCSWNFWSVAVYPGLLLIFMGRVIVGTVPTFEFAEVFARLYTVATVSLIIRSVRNDTLISFTHKTALSKAAAELHSRFYAHMSHVLK